MTNSTFYRDGYRDALSGLDACAPDEFSTVVYAEEYRCGYFDGTTERLIQRIEKAD